jgi:hypothetical protein
MSENTQDINPSAETVETSTETVSTPKAEKEKSSPVIVSEMISSLDFD